MSEIVRVTRIDARIERYDWVFVHEAAAQIDAHWAAQCRAKPDLYDGRVLLAHEWAVDGEVLVARYFETGFRNFMSWRDFGFPGAPVANCFAMAALRAADGAFILGEMSAGTSNAGRLYFPSGTPDASDVGPDGAVDLAGSVLRELEEETGLRPADVDLAPGWTIVLDAPAIACMKSVQARHDVAGLKARFGDFTADQAAPELTRLVEVKGATDFDPVRMPPFMIRYLADALARSPAA